MEIVGNIFGTYIPLCCLSLPVLGFFALVAALPVAFLALSKQEAGSRKQEAGSKGQEARSKEYRTGNRNDPSRRPDSPIS
jgi:hypothetical protein